MDLLMKEYREINLDGKIKNHINLDKRENYVYNKIRQLRQTLPFSKRYLKHEKVNKYQIPLNNLVKKNRIKAFPPINDIPNSYVAQSEHTILIKECGIDILN